MGFTERSRAISSQVIASRPVYRPVKRAEDSPNYPSDKDMWNGLSFWFGVVSVGLNTAGTLAALGCLGGAYACGVSALVSKGLGLASLPFAVASNRADCFGNSWDGKCWAGWMYTAGIVASTAMAVPFVSNGVSVAAGGIWMATSRSDSK